MIYNDAYRALLGDRHPDALGKPTARDLAGNLSAELGCSINPFCAASAKAFSPRITPGGSTVTAVPKTRGFTISYSPIPDGSAPHGVGGVLATAFETTERVRNEKALHVLTDRLEVRGRAAHPRTRPHLESLGGSARRCELRRLFPQRQSRHGQTCSAGPRTRSNRCMSTNCAIPTILRPPLPAARRSRARCANRAHRKPFPPSRRNLALDCLDHDGR